MSDIKTDLPIYNTPIIDSRGNINEVWWRFFAVLLTRTGGASGTDSGSNQRLINSAWSLINSKVDPVYKDPTSQIIALMQEPQASTRKSEAPQDVQSHGLQVDDALHAVASSASSGFMSSADKAKLDTIPGSISCFSAYQTSNQTITAATQKVITGYTKLFDDNSELSTTTSAFVPALAGTYVFSGGVCGSQAVVTARLVSIFVNGFQRCTLSNNSATSGQAVALGTSPPIRLAAGDSVTLVYFSSLADVTTAGQNTTFFGGWRIK